MLAVDFADFMDGDDIGVLQVSGRFGFGVEPANIFLIGQIARQDHLDRDSTVQVHLSSFEDNAHSAAGDLFK